VIFLRFPRFPVMHRAFARKMDNDLLLIREGMKLNWRFWKAAGYGQLTCPVDLQHAAQKRIQHAPLAHMRNAPAYFICKWGV
jgi:hypothetical protein